MSLTCFKTAKDILGKGCEILIPIDVVVAHSLDDQNVRTCLISEVKDQDKIFDIGPASISHIYHKMSTSYTLLWNGPLGVFETPPFDRGTIRLHRALLILQRKVRLFQSQEAAIPSLPFLMLVSWVLSRMFQQQAGHSLSG